MITLWELTERAFLTTGSEFERSPPFWAYSRIFFTKACCTRSCLLMAEVDNERTDWSARNISEDPCKKEEWICLPPNPQTLLHHSRNSHKVFNIHEFQYMHVVTGPERPRVYYANGELGRARRSDAASRRQLHTAFGAQQHPAVADVINRGGGAARVKGR